MQALGTKMATKAVEKSVKKELKSALPDVKGPRRRSKSRKKKKKNQNKGWSCVNNPNRTHDAICRVIIYQKFTWSWIVLYCLNKTQTTLLELHTVFWFIFSLKAFINLQLVMELGTRWRDVVIDAVERSVVHRHGHKSSAGVSQHACV